MSPVDRTILVIDDEPDTRELMSLELAEAGFYVEGAGSGREALDLVREGHRFAVAVTDYRMPGMDGIETLRALKEIDPELQVIVASGAAAGDVRDRCLSNGALAYLEKPFELDALASAVREAAQARG
jgi:CheY-like chemotaxis protein